MAARDLRYEWLEKIRKENHYDGIALAHHRNDVVETVLFNLVRGTGISGLHGILPRRNYLVRPLLFLDREEINEIIASENISHREDTSNLSVKYARNKLRIDVIPKLKELNPGLEHTFYEMSLRFAEIEEYFKMHVNTLRDDVFEIQASGEYFIDLHKLRNLTPQRTLLFELFRPYHFNENILDDLRNSWNGSPGKIFESSTHTLLLDRDKLILRQREQNTLEEKLFFETDECVLWGESTVILKRESPAAVSDYETGLAYIDAELLQFPLKVRSWKKGDSFYPLGMKGKKKLSDFFVNKKVPLNYKHLIPIIENGNGDIIWIAGYQTDNRYKITSGTKKVIILEQNKNGNRP
jgi:tRNA(Ile)-lysidine synthase